MLKVTGYREDSDEGDLSPEPMLLTTCPMYRTLKQLQASDQAQLLKTIPG